MSAPERTLREIFEWLGLPYSAECLDFQDKSIIHSAGGNPARFELTDGIKNVDERWRTILKNEDLRAFESTAGRLNREFGYE